MGHPSRTDNRGWEFTLREPHRLNLDTSQDPSDCLHWIFVSEPMRRAQANPFATPAWAQTEAALLAGINPARAATKTTTVMAIAYTFASVDETLKSWLRNARVAMMEIGIVTAMAMPARTRISRRIRLTTDHRWAPSAMRMPISRVRWAVE